MHPSSHKVNLFKAQIMKRLALCIAFAATAASLSAQQAAPQATPQAKPIPVQTPFAVPTPRVSLVGAPVVLGLGPPAITEEQPRPQPTATPTPLPTPFAAPTPTVTPVSAPVAFGATSEQAREATKHPPVSTTPTPPPTPVAADPNALNRIVDRFVSERPTADVGGEGLDKSSPRMQAVVESPPAVKDTTYPSTTTSYVEPIDTAPSFTKSVKEFAQEHPVITGIASAVVVGIATHYINQWFGGGSSPPEQGLLQVGGRNPINSEYAGRTHPSGITFTPDGFPDFSTAAKKTVTIDGLTGRYATDAAMANRAAGFSQTPAGHVWHHVEDGKTLQLLEQELHNAVRHTGGAAVIRSKSE